MSFMTKYGQLWGQVPSTFGRVFWVSPAATQLVDGQVYSASDDNDGLSPDRPMRTLQAVINKTTASAGDVIMMFPGTFTSAAVVNLNKAGVTYVGIQSNFGISNARRNYAPGTKVNWTSTLAGAAAALTVADCTFVGINMIPVTAQTFMTAATCPRTAFIDCTVTLSAAASTSTKGIVFSGGSSAHVSFQNCYFIDSVATSAQGPAVDLTGVDQFLFEDCIVLCKGTSSAWAVAIQLGAGSAGLFSRNYIGAQGAGTITIGIDGTGVAVANAVELNDNRYGVSPGAGATKNFDNTDVSLVNNYYGTIGAGAGYVIHTIAI